MKNVILLLFMVMSGGLIAQFPNNWESIKLKPWEEWANNNRQYLKGASLTNHLRPYAQATKMAAFDEELAPFYHGIASGDPMANGVIIWTRVTPPDNELAIEVAWEMATDPNMNGMVANGMVTADASSDFTVKVDVQGLNPNTTYYYGFKALNQFSLIGRTKTAPIGNEVEQMRFAVVTCSNYQHGFFNAYARIAEQHDLSAVVHLGDYIYEYGAGSSVGRPHEPAYEIVNLNDYRTRHSYYKLDPDLRAAHQQHPFIVTWDDHEIANNAWSDGAQNHNSGEGAWQDRKNEAKQAYFEWMPIREQAEQQVYRNLAYGSLIDWIVLDTRHEGRQEQLESDTIPEYTDPNRTILGETQYNWFANALLSSNAKWKLVANQVVFAPLNTLGLIDNFDAWDGYTPERNKIINFLADNQLDNLVFFTGDVHVGFAGDIAVNPFDAYNPDTNEGYDPTTGNGAYAVEMVTPSITSYNLDESGQTFPIDIDLLPTLAITINPHGKFVDLVNHGFMLVDVNSTRVQGDWYWVATTAEPSDSVYQLQSWYTLDGENFLQMANEATLPLPDAPVPAPSDVPTGLNETTCWVDGLTVLSAYPNPCNQMVQVNYATAKEQQMQIVFYDVRGKRLKVISETKQGVGNYSLNVYTKDFPNGVYFLQFEGERQTVVQKIVVQH